MNKLLEAIFWGFVVFMWLGEGLDFIGTFKDAKVTIEKKQEQSAPVPKKKDDNDKNPPSPPPAQPNNRPYRKFNTFTERSVPPEKDDDERVAIDDKWLQHNNYWKSKDPMSFGEPSPTMAAIGIGALGAAALAPEALAAAAAAPEAAAAAKACSAWKSRAFADPVPAHPSDRW